MVELWLPVIGYEGLYEVSSIGRVKSIERISPQNHHLKERIRSQETDKNGYAIVNLCKDGKVKLHKVHRLVCEAFFPVHSGKSQVNHKDGNKQNNCVDNLEWVTPSENIVHAFATGLKHGIHIRKYGEKNSHCKLADSEVFGIRSLFFEYGMTVQELSDMYQVGKSQIYRILHGKQRVKGSVVNG